LLGIFGRRWNWTHQIDDKLLRMSFFSVFDIISCLLIITLHVVLEPISLSKQYFTGVRNYVYISGQPSLSALLLLPVSVGVEKHYQTYFYYV
jgi:hypothetical protein